jgi:5-methylcytosine-specific restriction endonuclease McrA
MEFLIVLVIWLIWSWYEGYMREKAEEEKKHKEQEIRRKEIEQEEERRRPPVFCDECHRPNKAPGAASAKSIQLVGKTNPRKICEDCFHKSTFCTSCGCKTELEFTIFFEPYCQKCFENTPRNWDDTRRAAFLVHGRICAICSDTGNLNVHHKTYIREGCEHLGDIVILCEACHRLQHMTVHVGPKGGKYITRKGRKIYVHKDADKYRPAPGDHGKTRR